MDISIVFFFVELIRSATGGAWTAAQTSPAFTDRAQPTVSEDVAADERAIDELERAAPGTKVFRGLVFPREPIGFDRSVQSGPGSLLSTQDEQLPDFLARLAASGVGVEPGVIHEFGAGAGAAGAGTVATPAVRYRLRYYTIFPPTPFVESFTLMVPSPLPATPQPLLVVFHKFGSSNLDVLQNTDYVRECARRGWFLVCPLAGSKKHFGSVESQVNIETVIDWVLANSSLRIDRQRVYGVGFSMGGGAGLSYAARHRDPSHAILAALVNHSGNVSLNDTYFHDPPARFLLDFWFGDGSAGSADHWKMARSSVLDFDPITLAIDTSNDMSRNLGPMPLQSWQASTDPVPYLPGQNAALDLHMRVNLGRVPGPTYSYTVVPFTGHDWRMVDASNACDWLGQFTLQVPLSGRTLADIDGVFEHFFVEQDAALAFTPFDWDIVPLSNELHLSASSNLKRITIDPVAAGLSTAAPLSVFTQTADSTGDEIVLVRWPQAPSAVTRDGIASASLTYNPVTRDLTLFEIDGAAHHWIVTP